MCMKNFIFVLENRILQHIQETEKAQDDTLQKAKLIIPFLENALEELKSFITGYSFKDEQEEIHFFKAVKPQLFSRLMYYQKVYVIGMRMPTGSIGERRIHLEKIQDRINYFSQENLDFYWYYRSGSTYLDHLYFLRKKPDVPLHLESFYFERDSVFSTCYDFKVAKILANEKIAAYLNAEMVNLSRMENNILSLPHPCGKEKWTDKKIALVEIIYGIDSLGSVNSGNIDIKTLAVLFGKMLNVDLSDIYHIYLEIRARKGDRTEYLNRLIKALNKRMDDADSK